MREMRVVDRSRSICAIILKPLVDVHLSHMGSSISPLLSLSQIHRALSGEAYCGGVDDQLSLFFVLTDRKNSTYVIRIVSVSSRVYLNMRAPLV